MSRTKSGLDFAQTGAPTATGGGQRSPSASETKEKVMSGSPLRRRTRTPWGVRTNYYAGKSLGPRGTARTELRLVYGARGWGSSKSSADQVDFAAALLNFRAAAATPESAVACLANLKSLWRVLPLQEESPYSVALWMCVRSTKPACRATPWRPACSPASITQS